MPASQWKDVSEAVTGVTKTALENCHQKLQDIWNSPHRRHSVPYFKQGESPAAQGKSALAGANPSTTLPNPLRPQGIPPQSANSSDPSLDLLLSTTPTVFPTPEASSAISPSFKELFLCPDRKAFPGEEGDPFSSISNQLCFGPPSTDDFLETHSDGGVPPASESHEEKEELIHREIQCGLDNFQRLRTAFDDLEKLCGSQTQHLQAAATQLKHLEVDNASLSLTIANLNGKIDDLNRIIDDQNGKLANQRRQIEDLNRTVEEQSFAIQTKSVQLEERTLELEDLRLRVEELAEYKSQLSSQLDLITLQKQNCACSRSPLTTCCVLIHEPTFLDGDEALPQTSGVSPTSFGLKASNLSRLFPCVDCSETALFHQSLERCLTQSEPCQEDEAFVRRHVAECLRSADDVRVKQLLIQVDDLKSTIDLLNQDKQQLIAKLIQSPEVSPTFLRSSPSESSAIAPDDSTEALMHLIEFINVFCDHVKLMGTAASVEALQAQKLESRNVLNTIEARLGQNVMLPLITEAGAQLITTVHHLCAMHLVSTEKCPTPGETAMKLLSRFTAKASSPKLARFPTPPKKPDSTLPPGISKGTMTSLSCSKDTLALGDSESGVDRDTKPQWAQLEKELQQLQLELSLITNPPSLKYLNRFNLTSQVVLKVCEPSTQQIWCCLLVQPKSDSTKQAASQDALREGISWWKLEDLDPEITKLANGVPILQDQYSAQIALYQRKCQKSEELSHNLSKELQLLQADFDKYKREVATVLKRVEIPPVPLPSSQQPDATSPCVSQEICTRCDETERRFHDNLRLIEQRYTKLVDETTAHYEHLLDLEKNRHNQLKARSSADLAQAQTEQCRLLDRCQKLQQSVEQLTAQCHERTMPEKRSVMDRETNTEASTGLLSDVDGTKHPRSESLLSPSFSASSSDSRKKLEPSGHLLSDPASRTSFPTGFEKQLVDMSSEHEALIQQLNSLKQELRKSEAMLKIQFIQQDDLTQGVPIEFLRNIVYKFMESDPRGIEEHEHLFPVLAKIFAFTPDDIYRIQTRRRSLYRKTFWPKLSPTHVEECV